jgi:allophanate hydrolase
MNLEIGRLLPAYRAGLKPSLLARELLQCLAEPSDQPVWITRVPPGEFLAAAEALDDADANLPLYGIPFAVKDNIDVAGLLTTAACPGFGYLAAETAPVVQRLLDAGGLLVGKTNMDQFATGVVGTRSPYGACSSVADAARVSGGSSSGSAVAVALGLVSFALGTDTAGSGRVPAAFNGVVGLKPTHGLLSTRGVVPACASLDCISIFARSVADTAVVLDVVASPDRHDPWSRPEPPFQSPRRDRIGVPLAGQVTQDEPAGDLAWARALEQAADRWTLIPVDVAPLLEASELLYDAWVAERTAALGAVIDAQPDQLDATVAAVILSGRALQATDVFRAQHRLERLKLTATAIWGQVDAVLLPTTSLHPTHTQVQADPIGTNARLGRFVSFVNLMDMCAVALPAPGRADDLPFGITLHAPKHHDRRLLELGSSWSGEDARIAFPGHVRLALAGGHVGGEPLGERLTERGGRLFEHAETAPSYRNLASNRDGAGPALERVEDGGESIAIEIWELAAAVLGTLADELPAPVAIAHVELSDGRWIAGLVHERAA